MDRLPKALNTNVISVDTNFAKCVAKMVALIVVNIAQAKMTIFLQDIYKKFLSDSDGKMSVILSIY